MASVLHDVTLILTLQAALGPLNKDVFKNLRPVVASAVLRFPVGTYLHMWITVHWGPIISIDTLIY